MCFVHVVHRTNSLEPATQVFREFTQQRGDDGAEQRLANTGVHVRLHLVQRKPLFEAVTRSLEVALEPRLELRLSFTFLALEPLDEPLDGRTITRRKLVLGRGEPAEEHLRIAAGVGLARHAAQPSNAGCRYAPVERCGKSAQPAAESSQVDAEIVQGLAAALGGQPITFTGEILHELERDQARRAWSGVVEYRRVERHPLFSQRVHATGTV